MKTYKLVKNEMKLNFDGEEVASRTRRLLDPSQKRELVIHKTPAGLLICTDTIRRGEGDEDLCVWAVCETAEEVEDFLVLRDYKVEELYK